MGQVGAKFLRAIKIWNIGRVPAICNAPPPPPVVKIVEVKINVVIIAYTYQIQISKMSQNIK